MLIKKITDWTLTAHYPYTPIQQQSMETGIAHSPLLPPIDAKVPGSVYNDLLNAGFIPNPYLDMNSLSCEWIAERWWIYNTSVKIPSEYKNKNLMIKFKGIDYKAHISFNKKKLTETVHEGMFLPFCSDVSSIADFENGNNIQVVLESAPDEMGQIGYTSRTFTQKSRFNYKWDFCTRLIGMGLYDDVLLEAYESAAIEHTDIKTTKTDSGFNLDTSLELLGFYDDSIKIEYTLLYKDKTIQCRTEEVKIAKNNNIINSSVFVENPLLWNVNGYGEQNLYNLNVKIYSGNKILSDEKNYKVGFKTISYECCDGAETTSLPYIPVVNGRRVYIKGVNMSPCDLMYGCVTQSKLRKLIKQAKYNNINLIRIWGGGAIESFDFYNLCDECGIMIWQEFIQSSSGIDNIPSKVPRFLELLEKVSTEAIKVKRNHVSLTFWSGGNELMDENGVPSTYEDKNIALLKSLCEKYDSVHLMLPTSASGPREFIDVENKGVSHDVHGHWKYLGPYEHYKFYNKSDSLLHSEFGCDGMTNYDKLEKFLSKQYHKVFSMSENHIWRHHGEWWDTLARDSEIFGPFEKNDIHSFIKLSQIIQGEGIRYILDSNRRRKYKNAGSIIWQYNEPYPNISCTSLTDYWGDAKFALSLVGQSYRQRNINIKYDSLIYNSGDNLNGEVYIVNDIEAFHANVDIKIYDENGTQFYNKYFETKIDEDSVLKLVDVDFTFGESSCYFIDLVLDDGTKAITSKYFFLIKKESGYCERTPLLKMYDTYKGKRLSDITI